MVPISPASILDEALREAGIPIVGVSYSRIAGFTVQFDPSATDQQRSQAAQIISGMDARPRRPRSIARIKAALIGLSQSDRNTLLLQLLAEKVQDDPGLVRRAGVVVSVDDPET